MPTQIYYPDIFPSADANNAFAAGSDQGVFVPGETLTSIGYVSLTHLLTYTDEDGANTVIDLTALAADIFVDGASLDASGTVLTLTDNDGGTPDVVVDLSTLRSALTNNADGTWTHDSGNGTTTVLTTVSGDAGQLLAVGTGNGPLLTATAITSVIAGQGLVQNGAAIDVDPYSGANTAFTPVRVDVAGVAVEVDESTVTNPGGVLTVGPAVTNRVGGAYDTVDKFVCNGVATVFTLSQTDCDIAEENHVVFQNGLEWELGDDYTLTATQLTTLGAPRPNGAKLQIRYRRTSL